MGISHKAILTALATELQPLSSNPDRFTPMLDLALSLFHSDRAVLMILTHDDRFEFHSSQYIDTQTESSLERMGRALIREWSKQAFVIFTPESVTPEFAGGLLKRRPFRQRPFVCLVLVEAEQLMGVFFLEGAHIAESLKEVGARNLDIFRRLSSAYINSDNQHRRLALNNQKLLARLQKSELSELEKEGIIKTLEKTRGSISKAHMELGIPRMSFYHKLRRYRIKPRAFRSPVSHAKG